MKRLILLVSLIIVMILLVEVINLFRTSDSMTIEGYLLFKDGTNYLINDENFDMEIANDFAAERIPMSFSDVYVLNRVPFSFSKFQSGQKVKVWHNGTILESNPAKIKVLKMKKINEIESSKW